MSKIEIMSQAEQNQPLADVVIRTSFPNRRSYRSLSFFSAFFDIGGSS